MSDRPSIEPALLATLLAAAPARVLKKVEAEAASYAAIALAAEGDALIAAVGSERVRLTPDQGRLGRADQLACSCLLSPRCAHLLGIARSLPIADDLSVASVAEGAPPEASSTSVLESEGAVLEGRVALEPEQRVAASRALAAGAGVVEHGALALGALRETELLRAVHGARVASLPRLAQALLRVVRGVRALASREPDFVLEVLAEDLHEALLVAHTLDRAPSVPRGAIGRHRREMSSLGAMRLTGLLTEPVIASTGHAGVVTTLVSDEGRFYTLADVRPGEANRARASYDAAVRLGDATLSHAELARSGLFVQEATSSSDGRLGQGQDVRAVRRAPTPWTDAPLGPLFEVPAKTQRERLLRELARPREERTPGWDLVLTHATLRARAHDALIFEARDGTPLVVELASDHPLLRDREALRTIARGQGLRVGLALRARIGRTVRLALLGLFVDARDADAGLVLPPALEGRLLPSFDPLHGSYLTREAPCPEVTIAREDDPLAALARRTLRMTSGGRGSIGAGSRNAIERECRELERVGLSTAAAALRGLAHEALTRTRDATGAQGRGDAARLARAYLAAAEVSHQVRLALLG
ncbi:MAG: hypothetical protein U0353_08850 [Sandaracinus sp.]